MFTTREGLGLSNNDQAPRAGRGCFINGCLIRLSGSVFQQMALRESSPNSCSYQRVADRSVNPDFSMGSPFTGRCRPFGGIAVAILKSSFSFLSWRIFQGLSASVECMAFSRRLPHQSLLSNQRLFNRNIKEGSMSDWWRCTSYIKASAGQHVCNYLFQLSVKGGAFYSSQAETWQFPRCEILLTKV